MPFRHWSTPDADGSGFRGSVDNSGRGRFRRSRALTREPGRGSSSSGSAKVWIHLTRRAGATYGGARVSRPPERRSGCFEPSHSRGRRGRPGSGPGGRVGCPLFREEPTGVVIGLPLTSEKVYRFRLSRRRVDLAAEAICPHCRWPLENANPSRFPSRSWPFAQLSSGRYHERLRMVSGKQREKFAQPSFRGRRGGVERKHLVAMTHPDTESGNPRIAGPHRACPGLARPSLASSD